MDVPSAPLVCSRIVRQVLVSACPQTLDDIAQLKRRYAVSAVVTLQTPADRELYQLDWGKLQDVFKRLGIQVYELPILDSDEDDLVRRLPAAVELVDRLVVEGHTVLCHCNIGNGRSPTVVAAWLHWKRGWKLEEAIGRLQDCRQCEPNGDAIARAERAAIVPGCGYPPADAEL